jgi:integrase
VLHLWSSLHTYVEGQRLAPLYHVLAMTGMRRGEVCGLRWSKADLETGRLSVRHTRLPLGHTIIDGEPKTAKGRRQIALDEGTVVALRRQAQQQLDDHDEWGEAWVALGMRPSQSRSTPTRTPSGRCRRRQRR